MNHSARVLAVALALVTPSPSLRAQAVDEAKFCADLKEVVGHTKDDFASFRQKANNSNEWAPNVVLPGQQRCAIQRTTKRTAYACESEKFPQPNLASAAADANLKRAQACLGKQWKLQTGFSEFFTGINDIDAEQAIIFSVEKDIPHPRYFVSMRVYRMFQQPLEPDPRPAAEIAPTDYCTDLTKVVASGKGEFSAIIENVKPDKVGLRFHWLSNTQLAGWRDCYVHGDEGKPQCRYLSCKVGPMPVQAEADKLRDKVAADIKQCLGAGWNAGRTRGSDGIVATRITGATAAAYVEAAPSKSLYSQAWNLDLSVRLDQCK